MERPPRARATLLLLGPAFVAAIAYVDPGNVAANLTAGARYGYLLLWVLIVANLIAVLVQYQSAKVGLVTGRSLPELLGDTLPTWPRRLYWVQAELVAAATDIAEVIGGAIALYLLFGVPLVIGGAIVGVISMGLLMLQSTRGQRPFEFVIIGLLAVIVVGFVTGLIVNGLDWGAAVGRHPAALSRGRTPSCWRPACWARPSCRTSSTCTPRSRAIGTASRPIRCASARC